MSQKHLQHFNMMKGIKKSPVGEFSLEEESGEISDDTERPRPVELFKLH
jgi:hypothetical protein